MIMINNMFSNFVSHNLRTHNTHSILCNGEVIYSLHMVQIYIHIFMHKYQQTIQATCQATYHTYYQILLTLKKVIACISEIYTRPGNQNCI